MKAFVRFLVLCLVLQTIPFQAQTINHQDVVSNAKQQTIASGINPDAPASDECGRWEITRRVALMLVGEGAGLLDKQTGNNCQGFAVDIIAYHDGTIVDILGSGNEGPNTPLWLVNPNKVDPGRWRPAPALDHPTPPPRPPVPPPTGIDLSIVQSQLHEIEARLENIQIEIQTLTEHQDQNTEKIQQQIDHVVKNAERSAAPLILKILSLGVLR